MYTLKKKEQYLKFNLRLNDKIKMKRLIKMTALLFLAIQRQNFQPKIKSKKRMQFALSKKIWKLNNSHLHSPQETN